MQAEQHDELPERAEDDAGDDGAGAKEERRGAGEDAGEHVHDGADDEPRARHGHGEGDRGDEHELQHLGHDLLGALLDVAGKKRREDDGEERARVGRGGDGQAEERDAALGRDGRDEVGVDEGRADGRGHVLVAAEDLAGREAHDHGHEVQHRVGGRVPEQVGAVGLCHEAEGDEQGEHALDDAAADHGPEDRHDAAGDGLEELVPGAVLTDLFHSRLRVLGKAEVRADEWGHVGDVRADDDLVLTALVHDALDAVDSADRGLVGHGIILKNEAQPGHAVRDAHDVLFTADGVRHGVGELGVVLSHFPLP